MRTATLTILAVALVPGGCGWFGGRERPLGSLTPQAAETGGEYARSEDKLEEDVSPVRAATAPPSPAPDEVLAPAGGGSRSRPDQEATYRARLDQVPIPVSQPRPVMAEAGGQVRLVNTILAIVNDEIITREDILGPLRPQMQAWRQELSPEAFENRCRYVVDLRLRQAISEKLVVQAAERRLTDPEKEFVDATLGQIMKDLTARAGSALLLEEKLKLEGKTLEEERREQRERLIVQRFLRQKIAPTIHVTHSELLDAYRKVRDERYVRTTRTRMRLITIHKSAFPDADAARTHAEMVHRRASSGEDFARLAERYSHGVMAKKGGDWGMITPGAFRVEGVNRAIEDLDAGEVGWIVEDAEAFYVVKVEAREPGRVVPFTEVQDELEAEIRDRKYNETVSSYIQDLYERSYVQVRPENF